MIDELRPYPEYKDSGLPWLGMVPEHWDVKRLKWVTRLQRGYDLPGQSRVAGEYPVVSSGGIIGTHHGYRAKAPGVVMGRYGSTDSVFFIEQDYWPHNTSLFVTDFQGNDPRWCYYLLRTISKADQAGKSAVPGVDRKDLFDIRVAEPPIEEQAAIVRFLDHANGKIERAIRAKKKLIALLNEQKQAIIHRAVTRGLDPNVKRKPSGVPWLGEVPEHWELRRLRTLVHRINQGVSPLTEGFIAEGDSWGVLKAGCVNHGIFREMEHKRLARNFDIDPTIVVKVGDVLVSRACGSPQLVGSVARVEALNFHLILSDKTFRPIFRDFVDIDFMVFSMNSRSYRTQVEQSISGAEGLANNLPLSSLRDFVFAIPSLREAKEIANHLKHSLKKLNNMITLTEREISLLREYRTTLTADVVTGKLDVREAVEHLPAVAEELPAADELPDDSEDEATEEPVKKEEHSEPRP